MIVFFAIVFGFYFLLMILLIVGWRIAIRKKNKGGEEDKFISIVVAVRNEEKNIEHLLTGFKNQSYKNFEVILVDDHSKDDTAAKVKSWQKELNITVLQLKETQGKKAALTKGVAAAMGEIIVTTDADCTVPSNWLENINGKFGSEKINMAVGLVVIDNSSWFFYRLQAMEFVSVIGTGVATLGLGFPTMCNGANLAFRKSVFNKVNGYEGNEHIASGDDEFLMRKISDSSPGSIQLLNCVVTTLPQPSLGDFIQQRLRWASKWKTNSSMLARSLALFILLIQLAWLCSLTFFITQPILIALLIIKLLVDFIFIFQVGNYMNQRFRILPFIVLQLIYPIYVLYIGILSQLKSHQWKGRSF